MCKVISTVLAHSMTSVKAVTITSRLDPPHPGLRPTVTPQRASGFHRAAPTFTLPHAVLLLSEHFLLWIPSLSVSCFQKAVSFMEGRSLVYFVNCYFASPWSPGWHIVGAQ